MIDLNTESVRQAALQSGRPEAAGDNRGQSPLREEIERGDEEMEMFEHFRILVDKGQEPERIDKFIASHQEDTSRNRVQQAIKLGYVLVNDKPGSSRQ